MKSQQGRVVPVVVLIVGIVLVLLAAGGSVAWGQDQEIANPLAELGAARIVYVSCDAATLARDLKVLCGRGYRLERVTGFDLFPQTPHVEALAVLTL